MAIGWTLRQRLSLKLVSISKNDLNESKQTLVSSSRSFFNTNKLYISFATWHQTLIAGVFKTDKLTFVSQKLKQQYLSTVRKMSW